MEHHWIKSNCGSPWPKGEAGSRSLLSMLTSVFNVTSIAMQKLPLFNFLSTQDTEMCAYNVLCNKVNFHRTYIIHPRTVCHLYRQYFSHCIHSPGSYNSEFFPAWQRNVYHLNQHEVSVFEAMPGASSLKSRGWSRQCGKLRCLLYC